MKITTRCGEDTVLQLNEALLAKAVEARVVKTGTVRADTTVSANVEYPTDSGVFSHAVTKISKLVARIKAVGAPPRPTAATAKPASKPNYATSVSKPLPYPGKGNPARDVGPSNSAEASGISSRGAPDARAASVTSNTATAGTAAESPERDRAATWCGDGVLAHNLVKITNLIAV